MSEWLDEPDREEFEHAGQIGVTYMTEEQKIVFVTNDRWLLEKGTLGQTDEQIINEAAQGGQVIMMAPKDAFEAMKKGKPEKWRAFHKEQEKLIGKPLTMGKIVELAVQGDKKKKAYDGHVKAMMTKGQAIQVRVWRTNEHYTWRAVARAAFGMVISEQWAGWTPWSPPSNQLMGMALCERAAQLLGENSEKLPWN